MVLAQVVIENPVLNSPYEEPTRHFEFDEDGITDRIADSRRPSSFFIPIPPPKRKTKKEAAAQQQSWTSDRVETNELSTTSEIGSVPGAKPAAGSRPRGRPSTTGNNPARERRLFRQPEAVETGFYLAEWHPRPVRPDADSSKP
jgi:type III restriction enzyme